MRAKDIKKVMDAERLMVRFENVVHCCFCA